MKYTIENILPNPLKEQKRVGESDIWETTCTLEKGKNYLVTAPSGKGKSTFLHILYGLRKDFMGKVVLADKEIAALSMDDLADLRKDSIAIVFQDLRLFPKLSAMDNILLKSALNSTKTEVEIREMADQLGIHHLLQQSCETLSYGQRQRVAIIRALCQPFDFLLLDEPFSHLDEGNTQAAFALIQTVCKEQKAGFVLVSLGDKYGVQYDKELIL